ncbi:uncharacterized protein LACBIDRAFT_302346 [Laccaria bicolor S238N-H82]|uniref:Predicted protein n=1 Tax=Laccaria bicolor (strain S238N-H82 / ATCC MYA-4686) TaxID=486041 RepID=B0DH21_LACBS|nr:uncharacterized protein LACBIDRAFT_302346 [Laccaria bicolor S238N-H82]EDR06035.1 predicted protein [Laccaria bicolor S238N-H82]|eukprot:XP_001883323.1 predicted protein [Laccaria bicolor S238N-H82]
MRSNRRPYQGPRTQLVVSIDIGTTFSAASVCILQPGTPPVFEEILRWPKQANPDAKVPSYGNRDQPASKSRLTPKFVHCRLICRS